jgi:hypothetical protein
MVGGYRPRQEAEADCLAGALLLPRVALLAVIQSGTPLRDAAQAYVTRNDMLRMRRNRTGRQFAGEPSLCGMSARRRV